MVRDQLKQLRCDCGHVLRKKDVFSRSDSDEPFTFKRFGRFVTRTQISYRATIRGTRCPKCKLIMFVHEVVDDQL